MKCSGCGMELRDNARFCDNCGAPVGGERTVLLNESPRRRPETPADNPGSQPSRQSSSYNRPVRKGARSFEPTQRYTDDNGEYDLNVFREDSPERINAMRFNEPDIFADTEDQDFIGDERTVLIDPRRSRYAQDDPQSVGSVRQSRYANDTAPRAEAQQPRYSSRSQNAPRPHRFADERSPRQTQQKNSRNKKPLLIAIIALVLVVAILGGVIVYLFTRDSVSAAELQEAKDNYKKPGEVFTIDVTLKDPSNDNVTFKFDDKARISSCSYVLNDKKYDKAYTYDDENRVLNIDTTYKKHPIDNVDIPYGDIPHNGGHSVTDGGEVVSDPEPAGQDTSDSTPTEAPTQAELKDEDVSEFTNLQSFLTLFTSCYSYPSESFEYDCRSSETNQNILVKICQQFSCVNWDLYPGKGKVSALSDSSLGITYEDCPWWDTDKMLSSAMGITAYDCDTADWICTNIFNVSAESIPDLYNDGLAEYQLWKQDTADGSYYCTLTFGKGLVGYEAHLSSIKSDGRFYYVKYDINDYGMSDTLYSMYAVMELKEIDGGQYWSMYYNTTNVPDEITPFEYNTTSNELNDN